MTISADKKGSKLVLSLEGRLDTTTAPELEKELGEVLDDVDDITFDCNGLEYISSAGLRVLLGAQKAMNKKEGKLVVKNINDTIREVFEVTGFIDVITIE